MDGKTYAFNLRFTRPDENDAIVHEVGYNAYGSTVIDRASAEAQVRRRSAHLTILDVTLAAVMNEDGTVLEGEEAQ